MIRPVKESDYDFIITRVDAWWGGRSMSALLPRLFFQHFNDSSFIFEISDQIVGFLIGFRSQSQHRIGYVHFIGVAPDQREKKIARSLYQAFFNYCQSCQIQTVQCITSPINKTSIAFHHRMGFKASSYDVHGHPIAVEDYDAPGESRIVFTKRLI